MLYQYSYSNKVRLVKCVCMNVAIPSTAVTEKKLKSLRNIRESEKKTTVTMHTIYRTTYC